jgi:hypothetical protein
MDVGAVSAHDSEELIMQGVTTIGLDIAISGARHRRRRQRAPRLGSERTHRHRQRELELGRPVAIRFPLAELYSASAVSDIQIGGNRAL